MLAVCSVQANQSKRHAALCSFLNQSNLGQITRSVHTQVKSILIRCNKHTSNWRALGGAHVPPTKLFLRLAVNTTILKPRVAAATGAQYLYVRFSRRNKIPRGSAYDIAESNPVPASGLCSGSGSKVNQFVYVPRSVDTQHFIQIHTPFWVILHTCRQTTNAGAQVKTN